ncbi:MAG: hypothetical protein WBO70_03770, partial [Erysipelotrichaceae bacterium]
KNTMEIFGIKSVNFCLAVILIGVVISCGTRKTDISYQKQFKDSITIENHYTQATKTVLMDVFTAKPFDTLKPMIINGKSYFNVVITKDKSKINKTEDKTENKVSSIKKESETKIKETEKADNTVLYIGLFFVLIIGVLAWFKLPSFRKGI